MPRGLLAAVGAWGDNEDLDRFVADIYAARAAAADRPLDFPPLERTWIAAFAHSAEVVADSVRLSLRRLRSRD